MTRAESLVQRCTQDMAIEWVGKSTRARPKIKSCFGLRSRSTTRSRPSFGGHAGQLFGSKPPGWRQVQAICDIVCDRLTFGYEHACTTRTAFEAYAERKGVCRDFAHLAMAFCRCLNIPARYANGFLGDIGAPPDPSPMDYNAWFEVYLDGRWFTFDARHNVPRIGRITVARGRDAAYIALATSFGPHTLSKFRVWTEEIDDAVLADLTRRTA